MTQSTDIDELHNLTVEEIAERIPSLSLERLKALRELESKESPRNGVIEPIDAAIANPESKANPPAPPSSGNKQSRQASPPRPASAAAAEAKTADDALDWQREAYDGLLTIPQAVNEPGAVSLSGLTN